jgi:hypothetical protein
VLSGFAKHTRRIAGDFEVDELDELADAKRLKLVPGFAADMPRHGVGFLLFILRLVEMFGSL